MYLSLYLLFLERFFSFSLLLTYVTPTILVTIFYLACRYNFDNPYYMAAPTRKNLRWRPCVVGKNPKALQNTMSMTTLKRTSQTTNMSPRLNTHDSINFINQFNLSIKLTNKNLWELPGATKKTNMSPRFKTFKRSRLN